MDLSNTWIMDLLNTLVIMVTVKTVLIQGLGRLHVQCNELRLPLGSVITITIMITQFSKVIEYNYDYMTKVIDYNYDYN